MSTGIRSKSPRLTRQVVIYASGENLFADWMDPLQKHNAVDILSKSVGNPLPPDISLIFTQRNPEAQFLCGYPTVSDLFQGNSSLNCGVRDAKKI